MSQPLGAPSSFSATTDVVGADAFSNWISVSPKQYAPDTPQVPAIIVSPGCAVTLQSA
jgi:hypothetical protein